MTGAPRWSTVDDVRRECAAVFALFVGTSRAHADPAPPVAPVAPGDAASSRSAGAGLDADRTLPLDAVARPFGATVWNQRGPTVTAWGLLARTDGSWWSFGPMHGRPTLFGGGALRLASPLLVQVSGASDFVRAFSYMQTVVSLRAPKVLGVTPFVVARIRQPFAGGSIVDELGFRYDAGYFHVGTRIEIAGLMHDPALSSASYVRYERRHWDLGVDHWAQWFARDGTLASTHALVASAGVRSTVDGPFVRATSLAGLVPMTSSSWVSAFGRF